jgi:hypothetical protein
LLVERLCSGFGLVRFTIALAAAAVSLGLLLVAAALRAVFAAVLHTGAAISFRHLLVRLPGALRAFAALAAAGAFAIFAALRAIGAAALSLGFVGGSGNRSRGLRDHAHGEDQRHQQYFNFHIDILESFIRASDLSVTRVTVTQEERQTSKGGAARL